MPDETGRLSEAEVQIIIEYLSKLGGKIPTCEFCATDNWAISAHITIPYPFGRVMPPVTYPMFSISCTKCGHTKFLSAVKVPGLLPKPPPDFKPVTPSKMDPTNG